MHTSRMESRIVCYWGYRKISHQRIKVKSGVEQSLDNLNRFLSIGQEAKKSDVVSVKPDVPKRKRGRPKNPLKDSFLDFMRDEIIKERSKESTLDDTKRAFLNCSIYFKIQEGGSMQEIPPR